MGKLTPPEVQSVVLAYLEQKKSVSYIMAKTKLSKDTIQKIGKRGKIQYENNYKTKTGRPLSLTKHQQNQITFWTRKERTITLKDLKLKTKTN